MQPAEFYDRLDIPRWVKWLAPLCPVAIAIVTAIERAYPSSRLPHHVKPGHFGLLLAVPLLLATVPFLLDRLPVRIGAVPVLIGTAWLVFGWPTYNDASPFFLVVLVFWTGVVDDLRVGATIVAAATAIFALPELFGYGSWGPWFPAFVFSWGLGFALQQLGHKVLELQDAQAGLAHKAATDERQRIAHELHDVIAHTLAVTMLHLTGARLALQTGDPEEAVDALLEAERLGRASLSDVRRTVGLLTEGDGQATAAPQPGAAQLLALVSEFKDAGMDVSLSVNGDLSAVSPATGLGLFRIAQESLANAVKHAPGSAVKVCCDMDGDDVHLTVTNGPLPPANGSGAAVGARGLGLVGMRQRAEALAGRVEAGRRGDRWLVDAIIPT